jgi:hypothetical protein
MVVSWRTSMAWRTYWGRWQPARRRQAAARVATRRARPGRRAGDEKRDSGNRAARERGTAAAARSARRDGAGTWRCHRDPGQERSSWCARRSGRRFRGRWQRCGGAARRRAGTSSDASAAMAGSHLGPATAAQARHRTEVAERRRHATWPRPRARRRSGQYAGAGHSGFSSMRVGTSTDTSASVMGTVVGIPFAQPGSQGAISYSHNVSREITQTNPRLQCTDLGDGCRSDDDCCSGICVNGTCGL